MNDLFKNLTFYSAAGLNIQACDTVIIMEPWWNPFVEVLLTVHIIQRIILTDLTFRSKLSPVHIALVKPVPSTFIVSSLRIPSRNLL